MKCENCNGAGEVLMTNSYYGHKDYPEEPMDVIETCTFCGGTGEVN